MALTREFEETVVTRVQRDHRFRESLFTEAMNAYLGGDTGTGKSILRDLVNATVGFEDLAHMLKKPSKSLPRMLAPHGNPSTENFFAIVQALQKKLVSDFRSRPRLAERLGPAHEGRSLSGRKVGPRDRPSKIMGLLLTA